MPFFASVEKNTGYVTLENEMLNESKLIKWKGLW